MRRREIDADYCAAAPDLKIAWSKLDLGAWLAPVARHLKAAPGARVLDVGAGSGTVSSMLKARGHRVTAVEPVTALWDVAGIVPIADHLPRLSRVGGTYDRVICIGVIHHLPPDAQKMALARMAALTAPGGKLILGARHGPGPRPLWPIRDHQLWHPTLKRLSTQRKLSVQLANRTAHVRWSWLVFSKRELR